MSRPFLGASSGDIGGGDRVEGDELVSVGAIRRTFGNEGGGGGATELPPWLGGATELAPWLLKDFLGGGAGSRTRGAPLFEFLTSSSSLILSKFRNFSFSTKKDLRPE